MFARPRMGPAIVLLTALVVLAPAVDAQIDNPDQSTPTTLYFHIFDTFNKFVVNTQPMNTEFFEVGGTNFPTLVGTPANTAMGADYDFNTIYGTSTAGPVEYDFIENGRPRFHPERGIAADVKIDTNVQPVAYMYVDVRDIVGTDSAPNVLADLTFRVTMRTGDDPGPDAALDEGQLIMQGQLTATICDDGAFPLPTASNVCAAAEAAGQTVLMPDNGTVEFAIPMDVSLDTIPKTDAFNVRIDWWQASSTQAVEEDQAAEGYLRLHASEDRQPRLEMAIKNPVYIEFIHPQVAAGTLLIHTGVNSPWGTYDVDVDDIELTVTGPSSPTTLQQVVAQNQHVHGLHDQAAEVTYLWKFRDEGAKSGEYTIDLAIKNSAGTATASGVAGFAIEGKKAFGIDTEGEVVEPTTVDESADSPGVGILAALGVVAAALIARRK